MYAIVDIAGQQLKVEKGQKLYVHRLTGDEGSSVDFQKVLLFADDNNKVNLSDLDKTYVRATILTHLNGDKVIVFKKKRSNGYNKKNGHCQSFTRIQVEGIFA